MWQWRIMGQVSTSDGSRHVYQQVMCNVTRQWVMSHITWITTRVSTSHVSHHTHQRGNESCLTSHTSTWQWVVYHITRINLAMSHLWCEVCMNKLTSHLVCHIYQGNESCIMSHASTRQRFICRVTSINKTMSHVLYHTHEQSNESCPMSRVSTSQQVMCYVTWCHTHQQGNE